MKKVLFWLFFCVSGVVLSQNVKLQQQVLQYNAEITKAQVHKDLKTQSVLLHKLANLYWQNKIYQDAIKTFGRLLNVETALGNREGMLETHTNLGIIYHDIGKHKQSVAEYYLALPIAQQIKDMNKVYDLYHQSATSQASLGRMTAAISDLERALWTAQSIKKIKYQQDTYFRIYRFYEAAGNKDMAMRYYKQFAGILSLEQQKEIDRKKSENQNQAKTLEKVKDSLQTTTDSLEKAEALNKQKSLEIKNLNQEKQIAMLQAKEQETQLQNEIFRRNLILAFMAILLVMAFFLYRDYRKIRELGRQDFIQKQEILAQNNRLEQSQKKLLEAQTIIQEQNLKLQSYNRDLEKQVAERTNDLQKAYEEVLLINNDLDTLTYRASHDLKSPIASLEGLCNVALMEISPKNPAKDYFTKIKALARNMTGLLDHLSKLRDIKHTSLKITDLSLKSVVEKIMDNHIKDLPEAAAIQFNMEMDENISVYSDASMVELVLQNVLQNAVQFSLSPNSSHHPYVKIEDYESPDFYEVRITDNGEGIPAEVSNRIFNMFFRASARSKGAGLGLYTARAAMEKIGGNIEYSESTAHETVFSIRIPKSF